ncbi:hypothetical protein KUCAC02_017319 [Chaenocephalus aceratus]|uniref:Uncharacterized protein n=1 Tax=Chaenocephalus aceratus TaxID=36190 RepID=A0ACB9W0W1_CHAAC|nr:hypothetical protein KUCAC02_017319 [Chaenocephalus aceratus]
MRNTLMMLVALMMCALTVCADITPAADFDLQKMSGKWRGHGPQFANLNDNGSCFRANHTAQKTETPGRFHSQDTFLTIVEVVYDDYALVLTIMTKEEVSEAFLVVYSRTPEFSEVVQQKFTQLALEAGVLPDNAVILPQIAECPAV